LEEIVSNINHTRSTSNPILEESVPTTKNLASLNLWPKTKDCIDLDKIPGSLHS